MNASSELACHDSVTPCRTTSRICVELENKPLSTSQQTLIVRIGQITDELASPFRFALTGVNIDLSAAGAIAAADSTPSGTEDLLTAPGSVPLSLPPHPAITTAVNPISSALNILIII
jgi:hypothetical protein